MQRTPLLVALAFALSAPLAAPATAASVPAPTAPPDTVYFGEAPTGSYLERYDDHGSDVTTLSDKRFALTFYDDFPNGAEDVGTYWFHTRHGSRFYLSRCDAQGRLLPEPVRVSRTTFLRRVARTEEREVSITYDAKRNTGTFTVYSGYPGTTPDGDVDLLSCPVR